MSSAILKLASTQTTSKLDLSKSRTVDILGVKLTNSTPELGSYRASNPLILTDRDGNTRSLNLGQGRREDFEFGGQKFSVDDRSLRVNDQPFDPDSGQPLAGKGFRSTGRASGVDPSGYSFHEQGRTELSGGQALSFERARDGVRQANIHSPDLDRPVGIEVGPGIESEVNLNGRLYSSKNGELRIDDRRFDFSTGALEPDQHSAELSGGVLPGEAQFRDRPEEHRVSHRVSLAHERSAGPDGDRRFEVRVEGWDKPFVLESNPADPMKDGELKVANHTFKTKGGELFVDGRRFDFPNGTPTRESGKDSFIRGDDPPRAPGEGPRPLPATSRAGADDWRAPTDFAQTQSPALSVVYNPARGMFQPVVYDPGQAAALANDSLMRLAVLGPLMPFAMAGRGEGLGGLESAFKFLFPGLGFLNAFVRKD